MSPPIAILFGSQTGTAESYAKMLGMYAASHGLEPIVSSLNDGVDLFTKASDAELPSALVIICSTYGTGEFPTNAKQFWKMLADDQLPRLAGVPHAILGLGNSHNEHYNAAAKSLAKKLKAIESKSLMQMQLSCELQESGHDATFRTWKSSLWRAIGVGGTSSGLQATYTTQAPAAECGAFCQSKSSQDVHKSVQRPNFVAARVVDNAPLTPEGHPRSTRYLTLNVAQESQVKALGRPLCISDHVQIFPRNSAATVDRVLRRLGLDGSAVVNVKPLPGAPSGPLNNKSFFVRTLLTEGLDLSGLASRSLLETLSTAATSVAEVEKLETVAGDLTPGGAYDRLADAVFSVADALDMFPSIKLTLAQLLTVVPHMSARSYSVASLDSEKNTVSLLYNVPRRVTASGALFSGVCSTMMSGFAKGDTVSIGLEASTVTLPADEEPCLMIALGSGIGFAHSIIESRVAALTQRGVKVGKTVLYYGMHTEDDCVFRAKLEGIESSMPDFLHVVFAPSSSGTRALDRLDASLVSFVGGSGHVAYCGPGGAAPLALESHLRRIGFDIISLRKEGRLHEEFFTADKDGENLFKNSTTSDSAATLAAKMGKCDMFCMQCEQTFKGKGCYKVGVCGKTPRVSALQDLVMEGLKTLGFYANELRKMGVRVEDDANRFTLYALFSTLTNVNFDETRFVKIVAELRAITESVKKAYRAACSAQGAEVKRPTRAKELPANVSSAGAGELEDLGREVSVLTRFTDPATQNAAGLSEMLVYGLKGIAAYADHSLMNGKELPEIYEFVHRALAYMTTPEQYDLSQALAMCIEAGSINVSTMALLYDSNASLGVPTPTKAMLKPRPNKAILVSGHDLIILKALLEKTEPLSIDVYTHGEMLPAHSYPKLKAHANLAGHFGGAWMRQGVEFPHFPGPVLMTTNCLTEPHESYAARIFTAGAVGWKGIPHIGNNMSDIVFDTVIEAALAAKGFTAEDKEFSYADPVGTKRAEYYTVGFGHETILSVAPVIVEEIQKGNITRFFVVGGCDGYEGDRSYYTDLVARLPKTAVVLTVGCGKFRFNHMDLGTIGNTGIPRILDMGQCNDSYSAVQVALALAKVLNCQVSDLPLSIVLSWFEQKAIAVLLSCLSLGLKPIHVGPALPAFVTPDVLNVLVNTYGIRALGNVDEDLAVMLAASGAS